MYREMEDHFQNLLITIISPCDASCRTGTIWLMLKRHNWVSRTVSARDCLSAILSTQEHRDSPQRTAEVPISFNQRQERINCYTRLSIICWWNGISSLEIRRQVQDFNTKQKIQKLRRKRDDIQIKRDQLTLAIDNEEADRNRLATRVIVLETERD